MNDLFLQALAGQNKGRTPVWIMRQAGRYLPSYQALRAKYPLKELFFTPQLAVEVTLLPINELAPDAAILFSDILVIAKAFGFQLDFADGVGPIVHPILRTEQDIEEMQQREIAESLSFVRETIQLLRPSLSLPLIGFCGGPLTVASYLIEEKPHAKLHQTKRWLYQNPRSFHILLEKLTQASIAYLDMQIEAGVQAIQIFESFAHLLSEEQLRETSFPYVQRLVEAVQKKGIPAIVFFRGSCLFAQDLVQMKPNAISFDWQKSIEEMRKSVPREIAIQGGFDPHILYAPKEVIAQTVRKTLQSMHQKPGYIASLGHGALPDMDVEAVRTFIETVREARWT